MTLARTVLDTHRDAGLSWIAHTLAAALADNAPVPAGLNRRHPDFASFAVKLGRALGQETEAVAALRAAETDKSRFCLENDSVGAAMLAMLADGKSFTGTAAKLQDVLAEYDPDLSKDNQDDKGRPFWSTKRIGKRLAAIWQYVTEIADARQGKDQHGHATMFTIRSKRFERFETLKQEKSLREEDNGDFTRISERNRSNRRPH